MTQRIFDIENEKDMTDLWDILPDGVKRIFPVKRGINHIEFEDDEFNTILFKINWHDKTEITRPIQEANEADTGKLCKFWNSEEDFYIGELCRIKDTDTGKHYEMGAPVVGNLRFTHCRRLTKQEIEELI